MKNIKNILTIILLLAAPVAFGCSEYDASDDMDMRAPMSNYGSDYSVDEDESEMDY